MYEPVEFIWQRAEDGYEWQGGHFRALDVKPNRYEGPALVALGDAAIAYKPEPGLFLKFASVDADSDPDILKFASEYGLLGGSPLIAPEPPKGETRQTITGELRSHWQNHLHDMKAAVSLWQAIREKDTGLLARCIEWRSDQHITYVWPPSSDWQTPWSIHATIASPSDTELLKRFRTGDVVMPARIYLQKVVNARLHEQVAPRILWISPERVKMGLYIVPDSLIGCLWLQLATALAEFNKFQLCEECGKPMLVAPEGSGFRSNRKTCSNACRIRVYAGRKAEARRLREQKLTVREIAKRLDTGVEQVKRWIAKR
jgi:hypothetical protein